MSTSIAIHGDSVLAKRVTAAVRRLSDLHLTDSIAADVQVHCDPSSIDVEGGGGVDRAHGQTNLAPRGPMVQSAGGVRRLPSPDACAVQRVLIAVRSLGAVRRCFVRAITRTSHATEEGLVDALQPTFDDTDTASELQMLFDGAATSSGRAEEDSIEFVVRRVLASYTRSHLLVLKLDFASGVDRVAALEALQATPRILVGSGTEDGLPTTAHPQEFFRDQGPPGGERAELFVWEESVQTHANSLHLLVDHSPDSVLIPELLDAVQQVTGRVGSAVEISQQTDRLLGLWHNLTGPPS